MRGLGTPEAKSFALLSVSVQPPSFLTAAVALARVGAAVPSKKLALPYPTRSTICAVCAGKHGVEPPLHGNPVAVFARMTLPAVADMAMVPVASGAGSGAMMVAPAAC